MGQRALACASVENSFAPTGFAALVGAALVAGAGEAGWLDGTAAVGAGAAEGAGTEADGAAGAAVVCAGAAPPRHWAT